MKLIGIIKLGMFTDIYLISYIYYNFSLFIYYMFYNGYYISIYIYAIIYIYIYI